MISILSKLDKQLYQKMKKTALDHIENFSEMNWFDMVRMILARVMIAAMCVYGFFEFVFLIKIYSSSDVRGDSKLGSQILWNFGGLACPSFGALFLSVLPFTSVSRLVFLWATVFVFIFCSAVAVAVAIMMSSLLALFCHMFISLPLYFYGMLIALNFITRIHRKTERNLKALNLFDRVPSVKYLILKATTTTVGSIGIFPGMNFVDDLETFEDIESDGDDFDTTVGETV